MILNRPAVQRCQETTQRNFTDFAELNIILPLSDTRRNENMAR